MFEVNANNDHRFYKKTVKGTLRGFNQLSQMAVIALVTYGAFTMGREALARSRGRVGAPRA